MTWGRIWAGAFTSGLDLLNEAEQNFRRFLYDPNLSNSLSNNCIKYIHKACRGNMWITTNNGVNILDPVTEEFTYLLGKGAVGHDHA